MSDPVSSLNAYMVAATTALIAGDYATALGQAVAAQGLMSVLPKVSRAAGAGGGTQSASWDPEAIDKFIRRVTQLQGAALGLQSVPIQVAEPVAVDLGWGTAPLGLTQ